MLANLATPSLIFPLQPRVRCGRVVWQAGGVCSATRRVFTVQLAQWAVCAILSRGRPIPRSIGHGMPATIHIFKVNKAVKQDDWTSF